MYLNARRELNKELSRERDIYPPTSRLNGEPATKADTSPVERAVIRREQEQDSLKQRYIKHIQEIMASLNDIRRHKLLWEKRISGLPPAHRHIITEHYVNGQPYNRLCKLMGISRAHLYRRRRQALEALRLKMSDDEK